MNPLTKVKLINELNKREAELGVQEKVSWHAEYSDSAWVFVGGLPYELTEGDIICVFSQYGEIVNINLVRDKKTGKSKGFCFICYEDQRSTILAVDNFNGIKIKGRTIRVDHVANYRPPKDSEDIDDITKTLREKGCGIKTPPSSPESSEDEEVEAKKHKKVKSKKKTKEKKEHRKRAKEELPADAPPAKAKIKVEKEDSGYERYASASQQTLSSSGHKHASRVEQEQELKYERVREKSRERGTERGWQDKREKGGERRQHDQREESQERGSQDQRGGSREKGRERHWHDQREGYQERSQEKGRERGRQDQREESRERGWQDQRGGSREKGRERHWHDQREGSQERDRQDQRTSHGGRSEEKHKKVDDRVRAAESRRSRERWENSDKPSREKESSRYY
uniref:RNA-binding motif protein, X-linked 2 n=1 Tax=Euleptes europaea TaxID=460621 RepID=UPI002540255C|nr:RNA-binding motif protein, X-linked 2 [Euleptes europaea]